MSGKSVEINCVSCGEDTIVRSEPLYEGFKKTGEKYICVSCGHEYASEEEVPFKEKSKNSVFSDEDKSKKIDIFKDNEKATNCRHCKHYVVNPFTQKCDLHTKIVEATDLCDDFMRLEEDDEE